MIEYSVVVPVYNSSNTIISMVSEIAKVFEDMQLTFEIILTDDCSTDESFKIISELAKTKDYVKAFQLKNNYGQMAATICGIHNSMGKFIITIDDDFQYHPSSIAQLINAMNEEEKDIIYGAPFRRKGGSVPNFIGRIIIFIFDYMILPKYRKINFYTSFRLIKRSVFFPDGELDVNRNLFFFWEMEPSRSKSVLVSHHKRIYGKSNQNFSRIIKLYEPQILYAVRHFTGLLILMFLFTFIYCHLFNKACSGITTRALLVLSLIYILSIWKLNRIRQIKYTKITV